MERRTDGRRNCSKLRSTGSREPCIQNAERFGSGIPGGGFLAFFAWGAGALPSIGCANRKITVVRASVRFRIEGSVRLPDDAAIAGPPGGDELAGAVSPL
jgi:hypothetical protein